MTVTPVQPPTVDLGLESGRPHYRYYVAHALSDELVAEYHFSGVTWSRQVRRAGTFSGTLALDTDQAISDAFWATCPGKIHLYITRNGTPCWGGIVSDRDYDMASRTLNVNAVGFEAYLYRRHIWHTLAFANTVDQYDVARGLLAAMNTDFSAVDVPEDIAVAHPANSIVIEAETRDLGTAQDIQIFGGDELKTFGEALEQYSNNIGGFEYNIEIGFNTETNKFTRQMAFRDTPPSQFPDGFEYDGERTGLDQNVWEAPGNVQNLTYADTIEDSSTRFFVTGLAPETAEGEPDAKTPRGVWENEAYLSTQWPLWEEVDSSSHSNASVQGTLNKYAQVYGRESKPPGPTWGAVVVGTLSPQLGTYKPGDWCRIIFTDPFLRQTVGLEGTPIANDLSVVKRIMGYSVAVPDTNQVPELVTLTLSNEWEAEGA